VDTEATKQSAVKPKPQPSKFYPEFTELFEGTRQLSLGPTWLIEHAGASVRLSDHCGFWFIRSLLTRENSGNWTDIDFSEVNLAFGVEYETEGDGCETAQNIGFSVALSPEGPRQRYKPLMTRDYNRIVSNLQTRAKSALAAGNRIEYDRLQLQIVRAREYRNMTTRRLFNGKDVGRWIPDSRSRALDAKRKAITRALSAIRDASRCLGEYFVRTIKFAPSGQENRSGEWTCGDSQTEWILDELREPEPDPEIKLTPMNRQMALEIWKQMGRPLVRVDWIDDPVAEKVKNALLEKLKGPQ
jgi:hypothetical protein